MDSDLGRITSEDNERGRGQFWCRFPFEKREGKYKTTPEQQIGFDRFRARLVRDENSKGGMVKHWPCCNAARAMSERDHTRNKHG